MYSSNYDEGGFNDSATLGDRLAAYHDQGGGIVIAIYANDYNISLLLGGTYGTASNGCALLGYASGVAIHPADSLGDVLEPQSPLMAGVASLSATRPPGALPP